VCVAARLEEEALLNIESQAKQRVDKVQRTYEQQETVNHLKMALLSEQQEQALQDRILQEHWKNEDDARQLQAQLLKESKTQAREANEGLRRQQKKEHAHSLSSLERDVLLSKVERERRLRHLADDEIARQEQEMEADKLRQMLVKREQGHVASTLLNEQVMWRRQKTKQRVDILDAEKREHALDAEKREEQLQALELRQRRREFEEKLRAMHSVELEESKKEEVDMQAMLLGMEVQRAPFNAVSNHSFAFYDKDGRQNDRRMHLQLILKEQVWSRLCSTHDALILIAVGVEGEGSIYNSCTRKRACYPKAGAGAFPHGEAGTPWPCFAGGRRDCAVTRAGDGTTAC
jgi:hypothetical protein